MARALAAPWRVHLLRTSATCLVAIAAVCAAAPPAGAADRVTGSGPLASEARSLGDFNAASVTGSFTVVLRQGQPASVIVSTDRNLLPLLETVIEEGRHGKTLLIRWKRGGWLSSRGSAHVELTTPQLGHLAAAGSADIRVDHGTFDRLGASVAGSGDLRLDEVQAQALDLAINGSGSVTASGRTAALTLRIAGSGDASTEKLQAGDVRIKIAGSGNAAVQAQRTLDVSIAGSGDVVYSGPATVKTSVAGSGSVRQR